VYALGNPIKYTDPTGLAVPAVIALCASNPACATAAAYAYHTITTTIDLFQDPNQYMAGRQPRPNNISHSRERDILGMPPGGPGCDDLKSAIRDLDETIRWRKGDLNPSDGNIFRTHKHHIKKLQNKRDKLNREANDKGCNDPCP
jgi:hypothetical protein